MATACDAMLLFLHESFLAFSEMLTTEANCWETFKTKLQQLQDNWQLKGLYGTNALRIITQYQSQITWQDMQPDQFGKFYRFIFHICREPGKRNIPMELAVAAWRLVLQGRFRLLDRWCAYAAASHSRVVTEDTWRQVLDFSRTIHEDLSNYDAAGAWAVILDDFVEDMRVPRRRSYTAIESGGRTLYGSGSAELLTRQASAGADLSALFSNIPGGRGLLRGPADADDADGICQSFMASISPRCGSKRREPDVDVVAEQLSAMPLGADQHCGHSVGHGLAHPGGPVGLPPIRPCSHGGGGMYLGQELSPAAQGYSLQYGGGYRGTSPETLAKRICVDRQHQQQLAPPQALLQSLPCGASAAGVSPGAAGMGSRTASSGQPMSCSTGSVDSDSSLGPAGAAAMDCLQDAAAGAAVHCQPQHCQQRRAIKARRSGLSEIVKSAVSDALGF